MENKDLMVNIPLDLYNDLLEIRFQYKRAVNTLEVMFERAELNWKKEELDFQTDDMREFLKQIALYQYNKRVEELNEKGEEK